MLKEVEDLEERVKEERVYCDKINNCPFYNKIISNEMEILSY